MDSQQLIQHLSETPSFIERCRSMMAPGNVGYSEVPTRSGFGPESPINEHAMHLGDMEAAFVGNLAYYCMALGTIPPHSLKGLWFIDGECKGIHTYGLKTLPALIRHLIHWAPYIIGTEGVDDLLKAGEETRWYSKRTLPGEQKETWLTQKQAEAHTGRTRWTLWQWRTNGTVRHQKDEYGTIYLKEDLDLMMEIMRGNQIRGMRGWTQITTGGSANKNNPTPPLD